MTDEFGELREAIKRIQELRWSLKTNLASGVSLSSLYLENAWHTYAKVKAALGDAYYSDECRRIVEEGFGHPAPVGTRNTTTTTTTTNNHNWWIHDDSIPYDDDSPIQIY